MELGVRVAAPAAVANGSTVSARGDRYGNLVVQQAGGQYRDLVMAGNVHHATNTSDVTIGTALTATGVTFHLFNIASSGKNLVILEVAFAEATVTVTAGNVVLGINPTTTQAVPATTTALPVRNTLVGTGGLTGIFPELVGLKCLVRLPDACRNDADGVFKIPPPFALH